MEVGLSRGDLADAGWCVLKVSLPIEASNRGRGKRSEQNCSNINSILWQLRCGAPWRDVPAKYGTKLSTLGDDLAGTASDVTTSFVFNPAGQTTHRTLSNDLYSWRNHYSVDRGYLANGLN